MPDGSRRARWTAKLFAAVLVPALFFGLVEVALWAAGVRPLALAGFGGQRIFQREGAEWATLPSATVQSFAPQRFRAQKPENGFRFFTLGGSSAVGFPWGHEAAFTQLLGEALQAAYPERVVEPVNAAAMSYASHRMRILAGEVLAHDPDLLVLYEGHNEFIERRFYATTRRLGLLGRSRLFALLGRALGGTQRGPAPRSTGELLGVDVVREKGIFGAEKERREVAGTFADNLRAIVDLADAAGARVVLCTVATNVRDWRPNLSVLDERLDPRGRDQFAEHKVAGDRALASDPAAAAAAYEKALAIAPGHAGVHFQLGRAYEALARWDDARRAYERARDLDAQPSRALGAFNEIIRALARERGLHLVDVERLFEEASPHGLVGFNLVEDYVHPTPEGHRLIAFALYQVLLRAGMLGAPREPERAAFEAAARARPVDDANRRAAMLYNTGYVLASQGHQQQAMDKYRACLAENSQYVAARLNLAVLLYGAGAFAESLAELDTVLAQQPSHQQARVARGWALLALRRPSVAVFRDATENDPKDPQAWYGLAVALQKEEQPGAEAALNEALALEPKYADALCGLGELYLRARRVDEAAAKFAACAGARPDHGATRAWLGWALQQQGRREEAIAAYRAALALEPDNAYASAGLRQLGAAP